MPRKPVSETPAARDDERLVQHRLPDPTALEDGRFAKSRLTRERILKAAVQCLAERGYAATSTTLVAQMAGLTRAAMLYHYASRSALVEAVVYYVTRTRVEMYGEAMADIPLDPDYFDRAIDIAWEQAQTPEFRAFKELSTAARTDAELAAVFTPALAEYDRARRALAQQLFPEGQVEKPWFDLRRDIVRFLLEGLSDEASPFAFNGKQRRQGLVEFLKELCSSAAGEDLLRAATNRARGQATGSGASAKPRGNRRPRS